MITCITPAEMSYFMSILSDIVSIIGQSGDTIVVHSEMGDVYWEKTGNLFCRAADTVL